MPIPVLSDLGDLEYITGAELGSAAATTGVIALPFTKEYLIFLVNITGYGSGGDIASLRFNNDTGLNYASRYISSATGGVVLANNENKGVGLARMFALATTLSRSGIVGVNNKAATPKTGNVNGQTFAAVATGLQIEFGGFVWNNTSAQITSVTMVTAGGNTMSAGSSIAIFGRDFP